MTELEKLFKEIVEELKELDVEINGNPHSVPVDFKAIKTRAVFMDIFITRMILECDREMKP